jgi:hypothetical protein
LALPSIKTLDPINGRQLKEDNTYVNVADSIEALYNALVVNKDAGIQLTGSNLRQTQAGTDQTIIWANSAAINTQQTVTFTKPASPVSEYELIVYNPSTITDITVKIFNVETSLGAGTRDALVTTVSIPKSQAVTGTTINTQAKYLHGVFNGTDCKLVLSNDTVLGVADGFSAYLRIREVG